MSRISASFHPCRWVLWHSTEGTMQFRLGQPKHTSGVSAQIFHFSKKLLFYLKQHSVMTFRSQHRMLKLRNCVQLLTFALQNFLCLPWAFRWLRGVTAEHCSIRCCPAQLHEIVCCCCWRGELWVPGSNPLHTYVCSATGRPSREKNNCLLFRGRGIWDQ